MNKMRELKIRYLDMLEGEGCLNEILFDKPEWDENDGYNIADHGIANLIGVVPDDVIVHRWGGDYVEEGISV